MILRQGFTKGGFGARPYNYTNTYKKIELGTWRTWRTGRNHIACPVRHRIHPDRTVPFSFSFSSSPPPDSNDGTESFSLRSKTEGSDREGSATDIETQEMQETKEMQEANEETREKENGDKEELLYFVGVVHVTSASDVLFRVSEFKSEFKSESTIASFTDTLFYTITEERPEGGVRRRVQAFSDYASASRECEGLRVRYVEDRVRANSSKFLVPPVRYTFLPIPLPSKESLIMFALESLDVIVTTNSDTQDTAGLLYPAHHPHRHPRLHDQQAADKVEEAFVRRLERIWSKKDAPSDY